MSHKPIVHLEGEDYVIAKMAADRAYDLALLSSAAAVTAALVAVADFANEMIIEKQRTDIPKFIAQLRAQASDEQYMLRFGERAVKETLRVYADGS